MKIAIAGAAGRMGQMLIQEIARTPGCTLAAALEGPGSNKLGTDAGGGVKIVSDAAAAIGAAEALIDFTVPAATLAHARIAADKGVAMVIGTTGLNPEQTAAVHDCAKKTPIMWAANMSVGINVLLSLVEKTASMLDPAYDIEVLEMHHRHKIDAPSGTALALGRAAAAARGVAFEEVVQRGRDGITGPRNAGAIGFAALRGGDNIGEHHVIFAGLGERLELVHRATNRAIYAKGAVRAARWLVDRPPGLYGMKEVLGL
jgi:4-hydroxy-tetrahydrodipicolinate reductase